jgi:N6-adenosine-specific RNA methylase IME4
MMPACKPTVNAVGIGSSAWFWNMTGKRFGVILADPPWEYDCTDPTCSPGGAKTGYSGGVSLYYDTMTAEQIAAMPVREIAEENSVLFLWATNPLLPEAFAVMKAWGYKYKTLLTWEKENGKGMGYWFRGVTEHCLLGVRGDVKAFRSPIKNLIRNKVGRHSAKPEQMHEIIESVTQGMARVELFARLHRPRWMAWGNQVERDLMSPNVELRHGSENQ